MGSGRSFPRRCPRAGLGLAAGRLNPPGESLPRHGTSREERTWGCSVLASGGRAGRGLLAGRGLAPRGAARGPHLRSGTLPEGPGLLGCVAAAQKPGGRTHSDQCTPTAGGPLYRDTLAKSSPADAGWGARRGAPRRFLQLRGSLSPTLHTPPCRVGVCLSGCACPRLSISCACCVSVVFCLCVSVADSSSA